MSSPTSAPPSTLKQSPPPSSTARARAANSRIRLTPRLSSQYARAGPGAASTSDLALSLAATLAVTERLKDERASDAAVAEHGPSITIVESFEEERASDVGVAEHGPSIVVVEAKGPRSTGEPGRGLDLAGLGAVSGTTPDSPPAKRDTDEMVGADTERHGGEGNEAEKLRSALFAVAALLSEHIEGCENLEKHLSDNSTYIAGKRGTESVGRNGEGPRTAPALEQNAGEKAGREVRDDGGLMLAHERAVNGSKGSDNTAAKTTDAQATVQLANLRVRAQDALEIVMDALSDGVATV